MVANHTPFFENNDPEMNFQPAIRFWSLGGNNTAAYFGTARGITRDARPEHTAIFVMNNNFNTRPWVNLMMFGDSTLGGVSSREGPGYAIERHSTFAGAGVGRFRFHSGASAGVTSGDEPLFRTGSNHYRRIYCNPCCWHRFGR
jgi:hypothetical protein